MINWYKEIYHNISHLVYMLEAEIEMANSTGTLLAIKAAHLNFEKVM